MNLRDWMEIASILVTTAIGIVAITTRFNKAERRVYEKIAELKGNLNAIEADMKTELKNVQHSLELLKQRTDNNQSYDAQQRQTMHDTLDRRTRRLSHYLNKVEKRLGIDDDFEIGAWDSQFQGSQENEK